MASGNKLKTIDMVYIALFAVLIAVGSWISIPSAVPFTLQTLAVFCSAGLLGGKRAMLSIVVYIVLGAVGLPVFSGFNGGIGFLFGVTGGYIIGFILLALVYRVITELFGKKTVVSVAAMLSGLLACYALGTAWFMAVYAKTSGPIGLTTALGWCVIPFVIPDIIKLALAMALTKRLAIHVKA